MDPRTAARVTPRQGMTGSVVHPDRPGASSAKDFSPGAWNHFDMIKLYLVIYIHRYHLVLLLHLRA